MANLCYIVQFITMIISNDGVADPLVGRRIQHHKVGFQVKLMWQKLQVHALIWENAVR